MKTTRMKRWQEFRDFIDEDRQAMPVYWRGQADPTWPLASKFERIILNMNGGHKQGARKIYPYDGRYESPTWEERVLRGMRDKYLDAFRRAASGLRGTNPQGLSIDQWWALGRHYGLVTPLLDWSEKPYIAAFFALTELWNSMQTGGGIVFEGKEVAVYRLFDNQHLEGDGLRVVRPIVEELGRMHGQRGLFTWLDSQVCFELQGFLEYTNRSDLLTCIILSDQAVMDGLRDLADHGIDYRTLYPDMDGAARQANLMFDMPF